MATMTNLLAKPPASSLTTNPKITSLSSLYISSFPSISKNPKFLTTRCKRAYFVTKATTAASQGTKKKATTDERVVQVHSIEEFDEALKKAKNKLVVVEFAASHSYHSRKIYPFMVELSRTSSDVEFLLVMGDESEKTKELCKREKIEQVPHFSFYKSMEKIHEEEGIGPDELVGDVLYYGDNHSGVVQLHSREDVEKLIKDHAVDNKLIVLDVGLKHCGPCVKVLLNTSLFLSTKTNHTNSKWP